MAKATKPHQDLPLPTAADWQQPLCWTGPNLTAGPLRTAVLPPGVDFVRAAVELEIATRVDEITTRTKTHAAYGLLRVDGDRELELHVAAPGGDCWTFRSEAAGRRRRWALAVGSAFPATAPLAEVGLAALGFVRLTATSLLPRYGSLKHYSFTITDVLGHENLAAASDPDPRD